MYEGQVPRPGDREVSQDLWHALYAPALPCQQRAPQSDHHSSGSATHTPTPTPTGPSKFTQGSTLHNMCKSQVSNRQSNFVASAKTETYNLDAHVLECKGVWGIAALVGIVLFAVWLKKQYTSNCGNRRPPTRVQEAAPAPQEVPMAMMAMAPPRFALEYNPQPQFNTRAAPPAMASSQARSHQEPPQEIEGAEDREVLRELREGRVMRRFS